MYKTRQAALDATNRLEKAYDLLIAETANTGRSKRRNTKQSADLRLLLALFEYLLGNDDKNPLVDLFKEN